MNLTGERKQLATDLAAVMGVVVESSPPPRFTPPVAILVPGDPYVSEDQAPYTKATMTMEVRLVAPPSQDGESSLTDLEDMAAQVVAWLEDPATGWDFKGISEPYSLVTQTTSFPALSLTISTLIER